MVGSCPKCGSINTHDCDKVPSMKIGGIEFPTIELGSSCEVALLDDPTENPICGHSWKKGIPLVEYGRLRVN